MKTIDSFKGAHDFLSNFYQWPVAYEGITYPSVEHAYQAAKTIDLVERDKIQKADTAGKAKRLGKTVTMRQNWEKIKIAVMYNLLQQKFNSFALSKQLLNTYNDTLIEGNNWGDTFWGCTQDDDGKWAGENHLGKLLMRVRDDLQREQED